jgi:hypothetical protein
MQYSVTVNIPASGREKIWFTSRIERAIWLLEHGYSPNQILGYSNPANDHGDVFDVPKTETS